MKLLEVVRGDKTADDVIVTAMSFASESRKLRYWWVSALVLFTTDSFMRQYQSDKLALEGADYTQVDKVLYDLLPHAVPDGRPGWPGYWLKELSRPDLNVRDRLCDMGELGQKRPGFYEYDEKRKPIPREQTHRFFKEIAEGQGVLSGLFR